MASIVDILEMEELANEFKNERQAQKAINAYYKSGSLVARLYKRTLISEICQQLAPSQEYLRASAAEFYINNKNEERPLQIPLQRLFSA